VTPEQVSVLARVFGVPIDDSDLRRVADELETQLAVCERLDEIDLDGVDPAPIFDPRWT
jgi:Asp-tRNA(Asn)/Glu-tRNA(Gln) amidotransferase C subunit